MHCGGILDGLMRLAELVTEPGGGIGGGKAAFELLACACPSISGGRVAPAPPALRDTTGLKR